MIQSKSYLKILGIPYYFNSVIFPITSNQVEKIIKRIYFFNDIVLVS